MGEIFKNPGLANTLEAVAENGKDGFYKGWVADAIVDLITEHDGVLSHKDLEEHTSTFVHPINIEYKGAISLLLLLFFFVFLVIYYFTDFFIAGFDWSHSVINFIAD